MSTFVFIAVCGFGLVPEAATVFVSVSMLVDVCLYLCLLLLKYVCRERIFPFVGPYVHLRPTVSVFQIVCPSVSPSAFLSVRPSVGRPSVYLSVIFPPAYLVQYAAINFVASQMLSLVEPITEFFPPARLLVCLCVSHLLIT